MKIKAKCCYFDLELKRTIQEGEVYEVTAERGAFIIEKGLAEEVFDAKKVRRAKRNG